MKKLSFIIVNYRSEGYLKKCISSIFKYAQGVDFEIVIVNNDKKKLSLSENSKNLKIIELNKNIGFGASCNRGLEEANGEILCFLNPDTEIITGNIGDLIKEFDTDKEVGVIGPKIIEKSGNIQEWSFGYELNIFELIKNNFRFFKSKKLKEYEEKKEVDWVTGAAMLIKRDLFLRLEGFDENFFLYFEDIDLCKRVRDEGQKVIYFPEFKVKHLGGKSSVNKDKQKKEYYKSQDYYFKKWFGEKTKWVVVFLRKFHF